MQAYAMQLKGCFQVKSQWRDCPSGLLYRKNQVLKATRPLSYPSRRGRGLAANFILLSQFWVVRLVGNIASIACQSRNQFRKFSDKRLCR